MKADSEAEPRKLSAPPEKVPSLERAVRPKAARTTTAVNVPRRTKRTNPRINGASRQRG
jgi:hypothetical protein